MVALVTLRAPQCISFPPATGCCCLVPHVGPGVLEGFLSAPPSQPPQSLCAHQGQPSLHAMKDCCACVGRWGFSVPLVLAVRQISYLTPVFPMMPDRGHGEGLSCEYRTLALPGAFNYSNLSYLGHIQEFNILTVFVLPAFQGSHVFVPLLPPRANHQ